MAKVEQNQFIKNFPLVMGILGGSLLLINRLTTTQLLDSQARADALGVILCAALILLSLLLREIQPTPPESVELMGKEVFEFAPDLSENLKIELAWASHLLLTNTVTRCLIVYFDGQILLRRGIFSEVNQVKLGNITQRVLEKQKPVYLVDLKHYPGKVEFDYLPSNIQGLICQPMTEKGLLILATNIPRSYSKKDEFLIQSIAEKISLTISSYSPLF